MTRSTASDLEVAPTAVRSSVTVATWTLVSRVTGLGRIIVIGAVLGPTILANTFVATNVVPNVVYLAVVGTVLSAVVVPAIVRTTAVGENGAAAELLGRLAGLLLLVAGALSVLLLLGAPLMARLLTVGIADPVSRGRAEHLTIVMIVLVIPQIGLYLIAALGAAAQQAAGRFALPAAAPAVENIAVMVTVAGVGLVYGLHNEINEVPTGLVILLGVGSTLSVALHMLLQLVGAARAGLAIRPRLWRRADPLTSEVARRMRQSFVVSACPDASYFTLIVLAGAVPGGVLVLQMAYSVYSLPVALGARAISTAALPGFSAAAHRGDEPMFAAKVREALAYTVIAGLPPLVIVAAFASPVAEILANGELRVEDLIRALAGSILVLAVAQLAAGIHEVGRQALFARLDVRGPRAAALLSLAATLAVGLFVARELTGSDRLIVLAAAVLTADVVAAAVVMSLLWRAIAPEALTDRRRMGATALGATLMALPVAVGWVLIDSLQLGRFANLLIAGLASIVGLGVFAAIVRTATRNRAVAA